MKLRIIKTSIIFISVFLICLLISSFLWITNNYSNDINIDAVIFHIKYPLVGVNKIFIYSYILQATLPSFLVAIFYLKNPKLTLFIISIFIIILLIFSLEFQYLKPISNMQNTTIIGLINIKIIGLYFKSFIFNDDFGIVYILKTLLLMITIALLFLILIKIFNLSFKFYRRYKILHKFSIALIFLYSFYVINDLNIYKFLKPKKYSNFYEQNYIIPTIEPSKNTNNLIIILAESLETSFASMNDSILNSKEVEKINNLIPNLYNLAIKNINFSNNNSFGGIIQTNNTNWTIAGTTGYLCGIPLNMPPQVSPKKFLTNAICISDILNNIGYYQLALLGYDSNFAGSKYFFGEHKINYFDIFDLSKNYETKEGFWGIADSNIFDIAKKVLSSYKKDSPFVLYIPTADTHFPNGYVDKDFCSDLEFGYSSAIKCSDRIISDFIAWVKKQDFYKNTTIIILGDHLSMQQNFFPDNAKRAIFNVFINPKFSKEASKELIKNRLISHFDITPLILDSIGFKVESFGLGRNPLYKKTLLEEYEDFNDLIMQPSKTYESFWQEKSNKEK